MESVTVIKWKNGNGVWEIFPLADILHLSRNHAIGLFSGKIAVVAKEQDTYIVNSVETQRKYLSQKKKCLLFANLPRSEELLGRVGFTGEVA